MFNGLFGLESVWLWTILSLVWGTSQELSGVWRFLNPPCFISVWCFGWANDLTNIRQVWCSFSDVEFPKVVQTAVGLFRRLLDEQLQHCSSRYCFCKKCTVQKFCCQIILVWMINWKIRLNMFESVILDITQRKKMTFHKHHQLFVLLFLHFGFYPTLMVLLQLWTLLAKRLATFRLSENTLFKNTFQTFLASLFN